MLMLLFAAHHREGAVRQPQKSFQHSRALKGLAKDCRYLCWCSVTSRAPERDDAGRSFDFASQAPCEQDADVVMFIYRPHFFKSRSDAREREETSCERQATKWSEDMVKFVFRSRFTPV